MGEGRDPPPRIPWPCAEGDDRVTEKQLEEQAESLAKAAVGAPKQTRSSLGRRMRSTVSSYGFLSLAIALVITFFIIPGILLAILSFTDLSSANFSQSWNFIGLDNYERLFSDPFFPKIARNTVFYVFTTLVFFNLGLALVLALVTTNIPRRQGFFFRLVWLLPRLTPSVVYILMWKRIASADPFGIYNQLVPGFLGASGGNLFLGGSPWTFVILTNGFVGASFGMIIFTSALMSIPEDLITAAKVDGAGTWRIIRGMTRWRARAILPANRKSVAVAHVDKRDLRLFTGNNIGDDIQEQTRSLRYITPAQAYVDAILQSHVPRAACIDMQAAHIESKWNQLIANLQITPCNSRCLVFGTAEPRQFSRYMTCVCDKQFAAGVQKTAITPAGCRYLFTNADDNLAWPSP